MEKEEIIEELREQNPWWENGSVDLPKNMIEREVFDEMWDRLDEDRVSGLTGLRRVGKTTLLKHLIEKLLDENEEKRVCYFSFDLSQEVGPRKLIKIYSEEIIREPLSSLEDRVYFFFDEIQKVENWGDEIKSVYDKGYNVKFTVTGSSSMNITKGAGESLAGRIFLKRLEPFSFREFLDYRGTEYEKTDLDDLHYPENSEELRIKFREYFETGGLPELYISESKEMVKQIIDLTLFRDVVELFSVKRTDVLRGIFRIITENSGQKVNYTKFARDLDSQYKTVKEYIQHLKDSFLIQESFPNERGIKKMRKNPKVYVSDHSYTNLWSCKEGLKAETVSFNHLRKLGEAFYEDDPEVDILLPEKEWAFEVKYSQNLGKEDARNLTKLPENYRLFLVTEERYDTWTVEGRKVNLVPLWLLCLSVSTNR